MLYISYLSPICFYRDDNRYENSDDYIQSFYINDTTTFQLFGDPGHVVKAFVAGKAITLTEVKPDADNPLSFYEFTLNKSVWEEPGCYKILLNVDNVDYVESLPFIVSSDASYFENSVLISYTNRDNDIAFNTLFNYNNTQRTFSFRVQGGFKSSGVSMNVETENYRTQRQEIIPLYSIPYETETLVIGDSLGVPVWIGRLINYIFSLSEVSVNGVDYVRNESSIPEQQVIAEDYKQYNYSIALQRALNLMYYDIKPSDTSRWVLSRGKWDADGYWLANGKWYAK
ncbi:MAG: hypothetical protein PUB21_08005 [Bacteroidales bacterium]|nr:hypothetical protein [Bacteroidales bacterium]